MGALVYVSCVLDFRAFLLMQQEDNKEEGAYACLHVQDLISKNSSARSHAMCPVGPFQFLKSIMIGCGCLVVEETFYICPEALAALHI